jgi:DNA (cytosine-5)-methyltransferase 1
MNKTRLKVGTDFSGIGAPEMALNNLGIEYDQLFSCEIDKHARKSYDAIHQAPGKFYIDITKRNHSEVDQLDLYVAGFPCQAFSIAGQRKGFDDVRGTLFFDVAEFIKVNQPKMFVLENVKGLLSHDNGKTYQTITDILTNGGGTLNSQMSLDVFDDGLGYHCYAQVLNTKHYGIPQNRERIFIVGFKEFRDFSFPKKEQLNLRLKDILQDNVDHKYFLSEKAVNSLILNQDNIQKSKINPDIANALQSPGNACGNYKGMNAIQTYKNYNKLKKIQDEMFVADYRNDEGLRIRKDGNSPCLSARRHSENDISNMPPIIGQQKKIRRLTPLECFRLQAFPDDAFFEAQKVCSDTQLYKQTGNSISVNVLEKLFKQML